MTGLKLIIFDWDGTLMDSEAAIVAAMLAAFREEQLTPPTYESVRAIIGLSLSEAIYRLSPHIGESACERVEQNYRHIFRRQTPIPQLFRGVRETLEALRGLDYYLAVATGKGRDGLKRAIRDADLDGFFATTRTAQETEPKPSPAMLYEIMQDLDVPAKATLMLGDTEFDLTMARAAGTRHACVSYGAHPMEQLMAHEPAFVLNNFSDLPDKLGTIQSTQSSDVVTK